MRGLVYKNNACASSLPDIKHKNKKHPLPDALNVYFIILTDIININHTNKLAIIRYTILINAKPALIKHTGSCHNHYIRYLTYAVNVN